MERLNALYVMGDRAFRATYGRDEQQQIEKLVNVVAPPQTPVSTLTLHRDLLTNVHVMISGWGGPTLDSDWLERFPQLGAVFYGAGSVAPLMTADAWKRGIVVSSAYEANAIPVSEYTLAMILLSLKRVWRLAADMRSLHWYPSADGIEGCFDRVVGLVSLGAIGRAVATHLARFDVMVVAYDPHIPQAEADRLGVTMMPLEDVFRKSDVVSVHAPHLPSTDKMITGAHLSLMKPDATFINTSRGAIVREHELIELAARRSDLQFVLDVTEAMPLAPDSALYTLPNVLLTPHIAGSRGGECRRMGRLMVSELERYVNGIPLEASINFESTFATSHCPKERWA